MRHSYFLNINYVCNERCTFCAANLANGGIVVRARPKGLTVDDVERFLGPDAPLSDDVVSLAGGEPTLHPDLLSIVRRCAAGGAAVTLFTNGLRLVDAEYAADVVAAGVTRFEIALFGSTAESHEAVTRRPGSFEQTMLALDVLCGLREERKFALEVRLLVSRSGVAENAAICRMLAARMPMVDAVSLNRMILSKDAEAADAAISWEEARSSVNECAALIREAGYQLRFEAIPLCVFEGENADHVMWELGTRANPQSAGARDAQLHYLDPFVAVGQQVGNATSPDVALPSKCLACDYLAVCGRVEHWYLERFGVHALKPVRVPVSLRPTIRVKPASADRPTRREQ